MATTAAFSSKINILSPPPQRHLHLRSSSAVQFPIKFSSQQFRYTTPQFRVSAAADLAVDLHIENSASTSTTSKGWAEFAEKISGEWDGFGADFTAAGEAVELPEMVVPEAYREWEVKVFDWQTQCPTLAESAGNSNSPNLAYRSVKLLPTVGCEADAATVYASDERRISDFSAFAYSAAGCYVAERRIDSSIEVEHCLIDPGNGESRARVIQVMKLQESELKLVRIKVFVEQWYGPFRNGDQLGGCAIRDSAFAATERLKASKVCGGAWEGIAAVARFDASQNIIQQLDEENASKSIRNEGDLVLLPKQLWCSVTRGGDSNDGGEICCEVGWLLDEGRAITSKCIFSNTAQLKEIAIANETATQI